MGESTQRMAPGLAAGIPARAPDGLPPCTERRCGPRGDQTRSLFRFTTILWRRLQRGGVGPEVTRPDHFSDSPRFCGAVYREAAWGQRWPDPITLVIHHNFGAACTERWRRARDGQTRLLLRFITSSAQIF